MTISMADWRRAYERELPGGGYVAIDVGVSKSVVPGSVYEGRVLVERRSGERRGRHAPPVIAEARGKSLGEVVQRLLPTARCNSSIGSALLRRGESRPLAVSAR